MKKRVALLFSVICTLLIVFVYLYFSRNTFFSQNEEAVLQRVIDGDTIVLKDNRTLRLLNINSPEKDSLQSLYAYDFLKKYENKSISVQITGKDKYYRYLARIYLPAYGNLELVKQGFASKFLVDKGELSLFSKAEKEAIQNERGMWKKSRFFSCFKINIDNKKEIVSINSNCSAINLSTFIIKDESRKTYVFRNTTIEKNKGIILHSTKGIDNSTDLFWNSGDVWNDDRDSLYMFDDYGKLAGYYFYGY